MQRTGAAATAMDEPACGMNGGRMNGDGDEWWKKWGRTSAAHLAVDWCGITVDGHDAVAAAALQIQFMASHAPMRHAPADHLLGPQKQHLTTRFRRTLACALVLLWEYFQASWYICAGVA